MPLILYHNLLDLSTRMLDTLNVYVQPSVSGFGLICNLLNTLILSSSNLKGTIYQHLLVDAIASSFYALNNSFTFIIRCGALCSYGYAYWSKWFEIYFYIYIAKSIELFILLIEIHLAFQRISLYSIVSKRTTYKVNLKLRFSLFFPIGFLTCIFTVILPRTITLVGYLDQAYKYNAASFNFTQSEVKDLQPIYRVISGDKSSLFGYFLLGLSILQGVGLLIVLLVVNIIVIYKYFKMLQRIKKMVQKTGNFNTL